jgi:site-specific DNA recombinase
MKPNSPKTQRCAIYTRKSTEHKLDLAFNSLDAQREACEAYIKSQAHEGWSLVPDRFDDGGLSGASLERPALQSLLDQVRLKKIDIVVVYKVDRLTRSLADFAKLVELFDQYEVSFVSVTQSFNTTSSMGRLTLNVLLSFAQFEREVIGERVRDKIAASKRKGIWVGGPIPLGYRSVGKKLEIVPEEAALVRKIFTNYLRLGSIGALVASLEREGVKPKPRRLVNGKTIAAESFMVGPLAHLLKNRFYIGDVVYRGETFSGEHPSILDRDLFDAVQAQLADQTVRRMTARTSSPAILTGLIFDDRDHPMSPSHANKNGVRYRYYVSHALLQNRKAEAGSVSRVSAPDVEELVCQAARDLLRADEETTDRDLAAREIERVTIFADKIAVTLKRPETNEGNKLNIPFAPTVPLRKGVAYASGETPKLDARDRDVLLQAVARARRWMEDMIGGKVTSFEQIALAEGLGERHVRRLASLAFLSPKIIQAIAKEDTPSGLSVSRLTLALPHSWAEQEKMFGLR